MDDWSPYGACWGFAAEVAGLLDLDTLSTLPASSVAHDGEQRHADIALRLSYADGWGRSLVLLIEVQFPRDHDVAGRVLRYEMLAFDALGRQGGRPGRRAAAAIGGGLLRDGSLDGGGCRDARRSGGPRRGRALAAALPVR